MISHSGESGDQSIVFEATSRVIEIEKRPVGMWAATWPSKGLWIPDFSLWNPAGGPGCGAMVSEQRPLSRTVEISAAVCSSPLVDPHPEQPRHFHRARLNSRTWWGSMKYSPPITSDSKRRLKLFFWWCLPVGKSTRISRRNPEAPNHSGREKLPD